MDARRQAILQRAVRHQWRHRKTHGDQARAHDHGRLRADDLCGELHRKLRLGLIVLENKIEPVARDSAGRVDLVRKRQQRIPFALANEGGAAGKRQDDIDVVRSGGQART